MTDTLTSTVTRIHAIGGLRAWIVWFLAANCFFYAFFQRAAPSVMVDPLMAAFDVGAAVTGNLAALYLYVYALLQLPVGLLLDRWGREPGQLVGRSPYMQAVHIDALDDKLGTIQPIRITAAHANSLTGYSAVDGTETAAGNWTEDSMEGV